jgi:methionyl-tRNA synthetase
MQPLTPSCAAKMLDQVKVAEGERSFAYLSAEHALKAGTKIEKPEGIFPRIVEEEEKAQAAG